MAATEDTDALALAYVEGELDASARSAFEQRLAGDPALRAEVEGLRAVKELLGADARFGQDSKTDAPPAHLVDAIMNAEAIARPAEIRAAAALQRNPPPSLTARLSRWLLGGGALVAGATVVVFSLQQRAPDAEAVITAAPSAVALKAEERASSAASATGAPAPDAMAESPADAKSALRDGFADTANAGGARGDDALGAGALGGLLPTDLPAEPAAQALPAKEQQQPAQEPIEADKLERRAASRAFADEESKKPTELSLSDDRAPPPPPKPVLRRDAPADSFGYEAEEDARDEGRADRDGDRVAAKKREATLEKSEAKADAKAVAAPTADEKPQPMRARSEAPATPAPGVAASAPSAALDPTAASGQGATSSTQSVAGPARPTSIEEARKQLAQRRVADKSKRSKDAKGGKDAEAPSGAKTKAGAALDSPAELRAAQEADLQFTTGLRELQARRYVDALNAFQNAERLDRKRALGVSPVVGQMRCHAALGRLPDVARLSGRLLSANLKADDVVDGLVLGADAAEKTGDTLLAEQLYTRLLEVPAHKANAARALARLRMPMRNKALESVDAAADAAAAEPPAATAPAESR